MSGNKRGNNHHFRRGHKTGSRGGKKPKNWHEMQSNDDENDEIIEVDDTNDEQAILFDPFDNFIIDHPSNNIKIEKPRPNSGNLFDNTPFNFKPKNNNNRFIYTPDEQTNKYKPPSYINKNIDDNTSNYNYNYHANNANNYTNYNINDDGNSSNNQYKKDYIDKQNKFKYRQIEKNSDVFHELNIKLNPRLFNVNKLIYNELEKFNKIVDYIAEKLPKNQKTNAFFLLCKVFTLNDLKNISDKNEKSSIFSIFFDGDRFKLEYCVEQINISIFTGKQIPEENDIITMFDFFKVLIDVSISNSEILLPLLNFYDKATINNPSLHQHFELINIFISEKEENAVNSHESAVSPTAEDLFRSKKNMVDNHINKIWDNLNEYKKGMIALTKENFYTPFRNSLEEMKKQQLDARDLFLYKNVQIAFTANISNYSAFRDCNLFITFQIRTPANWKKTLTTPDWKYTDQLGNRSLLILSTSENLLKIDAVCRSCATARSPDYDESRTSILFLNKGILPVVLISGQIKQNVRYYMFEPTSCWPAVQPVLQRILKMNEHSFPSTLLNKIIKLDFENNHMIEVHQFSTDILLLNEPTMPKRHYMKFASEQWPFDSYSNEQIDTNLRVDHEQYKALRYSLEHNLTLVNGAPGTGKTHFAREYLRLMSQIKQKPIVIITYTNHALDAILEGVIGFFNKDEILRWGGPMRSTNPILKERRWRNFYLPKSIRSSKNEIVTLKHHLKNMYNIRQMAYLCIKEIQRSPSNLRLYQKIFQVLNNFFKASKIMASHYPLNFSTSEINDYIRYLSARNPGINYCSLPDENNALICWLNGEQFYQQRNANYRQILNYNRRIVDGESYSNPFNFLQDNIVNEEEDNDNDIDDSNDEYNEESKQNAPPNPDDINLNSSEKKEPEKSSSSNKNEDIEYDYEYDYEPNKSDDNTEEEEEDLNDKKFNDDDIIELTRVTLDGSEISGNLPSKYLNDFLINKFDILFEVKNPENRKRPDQLMIEYLKAISEPLTQMIEKFEEYLQDNEVSFNESETREAGNYLSKMKLIGMTSTVASLRKEALEVAGCEIMLVEEAGELTESMLSCILPKTLNRLILIGDYQQLRPKVEHELTKDPFNYDISLFEKLVVNAKNRNRDCLFTLSVQRRMHPQISLLVRNAFYSDGVEKITDASSTGLLGIPFGIPYRVRFIMHNYEENKIATRSHVNKLEAEYCASLVPFFICRGYKPEDITIIALYKGQKYQIEKEIENLYHKIQAKDSSNLYDPFGKINNLRRIKVVVLDNFQGEENKVIIVSLTRSNKPGFVKNRNRALVTLSRAREMLVVLGHERIFGPNNTCNQQWKQISKVASRLNRFSMSTYKEKGIAVNKCFIHKANSAHIPSFLETPDQVFEYRFSYCHEKCNYQLPCGHLCQLACHCHHDPPDPTEHDDYYCPFRCERKCVNGHQCTGNCGQCTHDNRCPLCRVRIHHVFPACGHEAEIECYLVTSRKAICYAECGKIVTKCGHPCKLKCGHRGPCDCTIILSKTCDDCGRKFDYKCGEENPRCTNICNHILKCGHTCMSKCYVCSERHHHDNVCQHNCDFVFPCGHKCQCKCSESFPTHQHYYCSQKFYLYHNFCGNHNLAPQMIANDCTHQFQCDYPCQHFCYICNRRCNKKCSDKCIKRCKCRCNIQCNICGKRCRALTGERCAIFCPHFATFRDVKEPPESDGILYVFHDNHFLPLKEAKKRIKSQYKAMFGEGEKTAPIHRLMCPCDGCHSIDPCISGSWLFDHFNKDIEIELGRIRQKAEKILQTADNDNEKSYEKINWYICKQCKKLFPIKYNNVDDINVLCPKCGFKS